MDTIKATKRDMTVKAKHLRKNGLVPGNVYGGSLAESISIQMKEADVRKCAVGKHVGSRLNLDLDGQIIPVQVKENSVNSMTGVINNVSFQALKAGHKVNSVVVIHLENTDKQVSAMVEQMVNEIAYSALPRNMVDTINIDVDGLPIGTVITVADVPELMSDTLELQIPTDEIIVRISEPNAYAKQNTVETEEPAEEPAE